MMGALGFHPSRRDGTRVARHVGAGALPDIPIAVPQGRLNWLEIAGGAQSGWGHMTLFDNGPSSPGLLPAAHCALLT